MESMKSHVLETYSQIAKGDKTGSCCAGPSCCSASGEADWINDDYRQVDGYFPEADLSLGCGIPTAVAEIREGDTVVDLGSGAGNDAFVARRIVGYQGRVIGVDMTPGMVNRARENARKLGLENVEFYIGDIETDIPISNNTADVVISNCVMNLVGDKQKAFSEVHRVLKAGGHFSISDIVHVGHMPAGVMQAAELYAGCISGSSEKSQYLQTIKAAGFRNIQIKKEHRIDLPDELLLGYISKVELDSYRATGSGLYSVTVYAEKVNDGPCCDSSEDSCCGSSIKSPGSSSCCDPGGNCC